MIEIAEERKKRAGILASVLIIILIFVFIIYDIQIKDANIFWGLKQIITSQAVLITDFFVIGGVGASFLNASLIFLFNFTLVKLFGIKINGLVIASFFTVFGFSFFGKNILNILPFYLGGILYSIFDQLDFKDVFLPISFASALAPFVSEVAFTVDTHDTSYINALILGVIIGFIVTPLSKKMMDFHKGFNLYNLGFTAGILGAVITSILRLYKFNITPRSIISSEYDVFLRVICSFLFIILIIIGFYINNNSFKGFRNLLKDSGLKADYVEKYGLGLSLINMGIMGFVGILYVYTCGMTLNGPFLAGIFTIVGFSAYGKHFINTIPILLGVLLGKFGTNTSDFTIILSGLFGTALAPIAGVYGIHWGIIAGWLHIAVVQSTGIIHGGLNLYNNGFSAGIVAGFLLPIMDTTKTHFEKSRDRYLESRKELYDALKDVRSNKK
ncbi:MAG: DUF1576 domain-containing protein [Fusobacteriaceae bacterium]|jgi:hypothetical protein|nr:DUF1576 domain-containing protein [Fusobacteriaceae bacterium]